MAKQQKRTEAVTLISPRGTKVSVAKDSADKYKARGYKSASTSTSSK